MRVVLAMIAATSAGCSSLLGIDDLGLAEDAGVEPDAPPDTSGLTCIGGGLIQVCPDPAPTAELIVLGPQVINTDSDPRCVSMTSGTTTVCAIAAASIDIGSELRAIGKRPLVLASMTTISIRGAIDVASYRGKVAGAGADRPTCATLGIPGTTSGGPGGSFGGRGGAGGGRGPQPAPVDPLNEIRGGCPGGRGALGAVTPGSSGGAVYLAAREQIAVEGRINASGAGGSGAGMGTSSGGAGGGAGGFIGLDAPSITGPGMVFANGGGGGAGGGPLTSGTNGQESPEAKVAAAGGTGGGAGGAGSVGTQLAGTNGVNALNSGGGGGGGAGQIYARGALSISGAISPAATQDP